MLTFPHIGLSVLLNHRLLRSLAPSRSCVTLVETVRLEAHSEMETMAETQMDVSNGNWILEGEHREKVLVMVARAIVCPSQGRLPVRILNPGSEPAVVYKGTRIARPELVETPNIDVDNTTCVLAVEDECSTAADIPKRKQESSGRLWRRATASTICNVRPSIFFSSADVFATVKTDYRRTRRIQHDIDTRDTAPIRQRVRRIAPARRDETKKSLDNMLQKDVIQPSISPWASPIVLVRKKDGSLRFCIDYRKVNTIIRKDTYPLPRVDDTLDTLSGSRWFTTLDLVSGYWQVEVSPPSIEKTAFCTPEGLFEFKVMPFGLCNAPATFQRLMDLSSPACSGAAVQSTSMTL